jgi:predicted TIM-barrel fold metal-dependent hydrolase
VVAGLVLTFGLAPSFAATSPTLSDTLKAFAEVEPIDTHAHVFKNDPAFFAMLRELHLGLVDICVANDKSPRPRAVAEQVSTVLSVVHNSPGHVWLCTTFDPFRLNQPDFDQQAIQKLDADFAAGAVAVKIWKNVGMEIKGKDGRFVMPDDPVFEPIYQDIAAHNKTLIAHLAEPDTCWLPPNPHHPDYDYYQEHPEWYMYTKPDHPSKAAILAARDRLLANNPKLRVVGAHLGSMETDVDEIAKRFDRYPNFAVDTAARIHYLMHQPPEKVRAFLIKYQDRVLYGTDLEFHGDQTAQDAIQEWESTFARDWKYFAEADALDQRGQKIQGLKLPAPVLRKLFHDNAVRWIPGIQGGGR